MARGGARPGAGAPKGARNGQRKRAVLKVMAETCSPPPIPAQPAIPTELKERYEQALADLAKHVDPMDFLLAVMRDDFTDKDTRIKAAALALPFVHTKPGEAGKKESKQQAAASAATGKFAVPMAPRLVKNG